MDEELRELEASRLPREFYVRDHVEVARDLLGKVLWHASDEGLAAVRIVETEAYGGSDDPGSHAFRGMTRRNAVMFGPPGHLYVYFTYGMHFCLNVVTGSEGTASAVLVRAGEPLFGIELMRRRRRIEDAARLACGPGNLCRALGVTREHNGADLCSGLIGVSSPSNLSFGLGSPNPGSHGKANSLELVATKRVGLSRDGGQEWRFFLKDSACVSGPRPRPRTRRSSAGGGGSQSRRRHT
jgi:DNA-3-methyladenine glycosylase